MDGRIAVGQSKRDRSACPQAARLDRGIKAEPSRRIANPAMGRQGDA
jgi:hypothetical protein